jgi:hypothetical protein
VSWDRLAQRDLDPPLRRLTLDVSQHRFRALRSYSPTALDLADPNQGALPIRTINRPRTIVLRVPDHVRIVELIP